MPIITRKHKDSISTRLLNRSEKNNTINWEITRSIGTGLTANEADAGSLDAEERHDGDHCTTKNNLSEVSIHSPLYTLVKNDNTWQKIFQTFIT